MELALKRKWADSVATEGELTIDGNFECYTLELPPGHCIPDGRYAISIERSPRFSAMAGHDVFKPRLHDVPGFDGVLIHEGNTPADTHGCILLGTERGPDVILKSRIAFDSAFLKLNAAQGPIWITITEETADA